MVKNILMAGVGGQGIILASNVACAAFMEMGYDVKKSEIHGMAQRGGSVVSHVRFGDKVRSPVIGKLSADVIISFEKMEFLRYLDYACHKTALILNSRKILPPSVASGKEIYPDSAIEKFKANFSSVFEINADEAAAAAGNVKAAGMPLLGELCRFLETDPAVWEKVIEENVPPKTLRANLESFRAGLKAAVSAGGRTLKFIDNIETDTAVK